MADGTLMLSVSGMRGLIGQTMTPTAAAGFAGAFAGWLRQTTGADRPHVVFGRDSRPSGEMVERAAVAGLLAAGCRVTTLGIVTTPTVALMIDHLHADGGMVATASHNPIEWNGLKPLTRDGVAPPPHQAQLIIDGYKSGQPPLVNVEDLAACEHDPTANVVHVQRLIDAVDVEAIRAAKLKVVLDSVHGAGGPATAVLLDKLGVECVHLFAEPTGQFPHTPEPTKDNLTGLCDAVAEHGGDVGLAQDPDADRLALVDENGVYIGEEYTLALAAMHVMSKTPGAAAANLSTSRMVDDIAAEHGQTVHRTPVGEANVSLRMRDEQCVIGGEGNGGVIWPIIGYVRDSLTGIALVLELLAERQQPLSELVASIPRYTIIKQKQPIQPGMADMAVEKLNEAFAGQRIDTQDGIRIDTEAGWVHVRPSNTEPILRVIAEAADEAAAAVLIDQVRRVIG